MKKEMLFFVFLIAFLTVSCSDDNIENSLGEDVNKIVLSPEEYTSIAYDNPKELSEKEIVDLIGDFQDVNAKFKNETTTRRIGNLKASIMNKYYLDAHKGIIEQSSSRSLNNRGIDIPIFEVELLGDYSKKDFAIVCGDERAPKVLFYANNYNSSAGVNIEMKYLMEVAKKSVLSDIEMIERLRSEKRTSTLNKICRELNLSQEQITDDLIKKQIVTTDELVTRDYNPSGGIIQPTRIISMVSPMSRVVWNQTAPYNIEMPKDNVWNGVGIAKDDNIFVGCANVAVATLFSIIRPAMVGTTSIGRQILIDWDYVTSTSSLKYNSPYMMKEMICSLLRAVYNGTNSQPVYEKMTGYDIDGNEVLTNAVVETATAPINMLSYIQTLAVFPKERKFDANLAKQSLLDHKPILLYGNGYYIDNDRKPVEDEKYKGKKPGHAWLIDGYCITKKSGQAVNDQYWSVNMGWGVGSSNVYFKTQSNFQDCDVCFNVDRNTNIVYYTQEQNMLYNITKK